MSATSCGAPGRKTIRATRAIQTHRRPADGEDFCACGQNQTWPPTAQRRDGSRWERSARGRAPMGLVVPICHVSPGSMPSRISCERLRLASWSWVLLSKAGLTYDDIAYTVIGSPRLRTRQGLDAAGPSFGTVECPKGIRRVWPSAFGFARPSRWSSATERGSWVERSHFAEHVPADAS